MPQQWQGNVTTVIAVLSLILNFIQMWQRRSERKGKCRVTLQTAIDTFPKTLTGLMIRVGVQNHGVTDVSFFGDCASIEVAGSRQRLRVVNNDAGLYNRPETLKHGQQMSVFGSAEALNAELREIFGPGVRKIRADVTDQLYRHYKSKWVRFDVT